MQWPSSYVRYNSYLPVVTILKDFKNASPKQNPLLLKHNRLQRNAFYCIPKSDKLLMCPRKFMIVKIIKTIEVTTFIKQGYPISNYTNSEAS